MPIILPQVDYGPLYSAISLKTGAKSSLIGAQSLDITSRMRELEQRQLSAAKRWNKTKAILGAAELLLEFGQNVYGIFEQHKFESAKADLHALQLEMTGKVQTYIDNNQFSWSTDSEGNKIMKMPAEFDQWYQQALNDIENKYKHFHRVRSWIKEQFYQIYDQSTATALNYGRQYAMGQTLDQFNRNVENAMTDAVSSGDFAPVEAVITSAQNWLGKPQVENLMATKRKEFDARMVGKEVRAIAKSKGYYAAIEYIQGLDLPVERNKELLNELNLWKAQELIAVEEKREEQYQKARLGIEEGKIITVAALYDMTQFPDLTVPDRRALETELDYKLDEANGRILKQKQHILKDIEAALDFKDFEGAQKALDEAIKRGEVDKEDPDIKRVQYILEQTQKPVPDKEAAKEVNKTRIELRLLANDLEGIEPDLVEHGKQYAEFKDTSDFISHIREQLEQREQKEREGPVFKTTMGAIEYFETIYYKDGVTEDELKELRQWVRSEFGITVGKDKKSTWERMIDNKIETLKKEKPNFYLEAAKRGIIKQYNEEIKDLAADDELEKAGQKEREKYEIEGMFDTWYEDFVRKNNREPTPEEIEAATKNFTKPLLTDLVRRQLSRGLKRGVTGGTPWQTRIMSPAEVMRWWSEEGRLDKYGRLVGVPLEQQLQTLGIRSFEELDLAWLREEGVNVLPPLEDPQLHYVEGPNGEIGVYDERTGEIRDPYTGELITKL